jgi:hypothetical protein
VLGSRQPLQTSKARRQSHDNIKEKRRNIFSSPPLSLALAPRSQFRLLRAGHGMDIVDVILSYTVIYSLIFFHTLPYSIGHFVKPEPPESSLELFRNGPM